MYKTKTISTSIAYKEIKKKKIIKAETNIKQNQLGIPHKKTQDNMIIYEYI